jgi:Arc/MetJ family transcription regulator
MKTTIEIPDSLLATARRVAAREGITLRQLVEEGLRRVVGERRKDAPFRLRRASFKGQGLQPGLTDGTWERIRDLAYEGRGA